MKKTVRAVLRTRMGIIMMRTEGQRLWGFIEIPVGENDVSWEHTLIRELPKITGIKAHLTRIRRITSRTSQRGASTRKRQTIYCEIVVPDTQILAEIRSWGPDGEEVGEIPYHRARDVTCVRKNVRDFLARYHLLRAPRLQTLMNRR